jgi:hypothetical protein
MSINPEKISGKGGDTWISIEPWWVASCRGSVGCLVKLLVRSGGKGAQGPCRRGGAEGP